MSALRPAAARRHEPWTRPERVRLAWAVLACVAGGLAVVQLLWQLRGGYYGFDFRGGIWGAGRSLLEGRSPFPSVTDWRWLQLHANGFINPPPLAVLGAGLAWLPFGAAVAVFNVLCAAGLVGALWLTGVRDRLVLWLAACSFPFVSSLALGQPDGLLAVLAALAWRDRDRDRGAVCAGVLIAAKLLAWPLIGWLLVTRRLRGAVISGVAAAGTLGLSWAVIGFRGLTSYPRLLTGDAQAFEDHAHSFFTALSRIGAGPGAAAVLTVGLAVALTGAVVTCARGSDLGWFTAALTLGIWASPIVWQHYLVLMFVALCATRRPRDPLAWLLVLGLWLSPSETPATLAQAWLIPLLASGLSVRIGMLSRRPVPVGAAAPVSATA